MFVVFLLKISPQIQRPDMNTWIAVVDACNMSNNNNSNRRHVNTNKDNYKIICAEYAAGRALALDPWRKELYTKLRDMYLVKRVRSK